VSLWRLTLSADSARKLVGSLESVLYVFESFLGDRLMKPLDLIDQFAEGFLHFVGVGRADVSPDFPSACSKPRHILKAATRKRLRLAACRKSERSRKQLRRVTHAGDHSIMGFSREKRRTAAYSFDHFDNSLDGFCARAGRYSVGCAFEQIRVGELDSAFLASGHGMPADEEHVVGQGFSGGAANLAFGASGVGDDSAAL
jgi:hypothetical protein